MVEEGHQRPHQPVQIKCPAQLHTSLCSLSTLLINYLISLVSRWKKAWAHEIREGQWSLGKQHHPREPLPYLIHPSYNLKSWHAFVNHFLVSVFGGATILCTLIINKWTWKKKSFWEINHLGVITSYIKIPVNLT